MPSRLVSEVSAVDFSSQAPAESFGEQSRTDVSHGFNLADYPAIYVLPQGLSIAERAETNQKLKSMQADVVSSIGQARLILSFTKGAIRAKHDLVSERFENVDRLQVPPIESPGNTQQLSFRGKPGSQPKADRGHDPIALGNPTLINDAESTNSLIVIDATAHTIASNQSILDPTKVVVVKLQWLYGSINERKLLPLNDFILLEGPWKPRKQVPGSPNVKRKRISSPSYTPSSLSTTIHHQRIIESPSRPSKRVLLAQETTEELEAIEQRPVPEWVRKQIKFSCQRKQTQPTANEDFLAELKLIKHKRMLDDTHKEKIRNSYGRAISSIIAYPYRFLHPSEVERLPSCGEKFGKLFREFQAQGFLSEANEMKTDPKLKTIDLFWNIHGVGSHGASILYDKGYRTLDGLKYRVWPSLVELVEDNPIEKARLDTLPDPGLDREQQQGLKFYEDFQERISRSECEDIAKVVERHLKQLTDHRAEAMLVGSYRKGKITSGDVDIVVSHPDESMTANLVEALYDSLDEEGWIRAKLKISLAHTHRDQKPVFKGHSASSGGGGSFAALDIALLVWQDINWPTKEQDLAEDPDARNPATCRRVDIIVSPWKSVGCAVLGWSGGITFERDLREYAHQVLELKFDSSGVMDRKTGLWVDIEQYDDPATRAKTIAEAERRVIEGLGLECFDPKERLTD